MRKYTFTRFWADVLVALGVIVICLAPVLGVLLASVDRLPTASVWQGRIVGGIAGLIVGVLVGTPLIVAGQLTHVQLDQRALLAAHRRLLTQIRDAFGPTPT